MTTTTNQHIRFCDNNHAELISSSINYSSELAAFPGSNSINKFRSKTWKPSGYFLITLNVNDKLYIEDGLSLTITLTPGEYATPALLAAHIQTQLNADSSGWTVDHNNAAGAYKFRFANASAYTLRFSETTAAVWNDLGFMSTSDEVISTSITADEQRNHMYEFVIWDLGYNAPIEFFSIIGPLGETFSISDTATIKLQGNNLNSFDSPPLDLTLTRSDAGIFRFMDDQSDSSYRFWRFYFEDKFNPDGPEGFSISYSYLGDYTTLTGTNVQIGFNKTLEDPSLKTESESGAIYFDQKTKYTKIERASINVLDKNARDTLEELFDAFGVTTPFFISFDPRTCVTNNIYDLTKYVVFDDSPTFSHVQGQYFNMSLKFREVL